MAFDLSLLGVKRNIPKIDFKDYSGMLQGGVKVGKTTFVQKIPQTVILAFEEGYTDKVVNARDCAGEDGWDMFIEFLDSVEEYREEIGNDIKLLAIDTLERMYESVDNYTCRRMSIQDGEVYKSIGDIPHGKGYVEKDKDFKKQINRMYRLGLKPLYLTHTQIKTVRPKGKGQEPYDIVVPTIPDRCMNIIKPEVSYIISMEQVTIDGEKTRILRVDGCEEMDIGSRVYIDENIQFDTEQEAVDKFSEIWKKNIERRLRDAGIKDDVDKLADEQDKERINKAVETINNEKEKKENKITDKMELSNWCKSLMKDKKITQKEIIAILKQFGYKNFEIEKEEDISSIVDKIKEKVD